MFTLPSYYFDFLMFCLILNFIPFENKLRWPLSCNHEQIKLYCFDFLMFCLKLNLEVSSDGCLDIIVSIVARYTYVSPGKLMHVYLNYSGIPEAYKIL